MGIFFSSRKRKRRTLHDGSRIGSGAEIVGSGSFWKSLPKSVEMIQQRFMHLEKTNYTIAHVHLRRHYFFDARRCFLKVIKRNSEHEGAKFFLAFTQLISGGKHTAIGINALENPERSGFPSYAEEASYVLTMRYAGSKSTQADVPFRLMALSEQELYYHPHEILQRAKKNERNMPLVSPEAGMYASKDDVKVIDETSLFFITRDAERDAAVFLVNTLTDYVPAERDAAFLILGDMSGEINAYLKEKNIVGNMRSYMLQYPVPLLIGSDEESLPKPTGIEIDHFDAIKTLPDVAYTAILCPTLVRYAARPSVLFEKVRHVLAPGAAVAFTVAIMPEDDAPATFFPTLNMYAFGLQTLRQMMEEDGYEYLKIRPLLRHGYDMRRVLCVYRMPKDR